MARSGRKFLSALVMILFLAFIGGLFMIGLAYLLFPGDGVLEAPFSGKKIAVVKIEGMILDGENTIRQIRKWADNDSVAAILLRINSPGGAVAPSQEIHREVLKAEKKKPVIASMGTLAASGGYYVASACRYIVADPGTLTGSIGVIITFSNTEKLMEKIGLHSIVLKSGKFKDTGSPHRSFTKEDRELMQGIVDDIYAQFIEDVAKGRNMDLEEVRTLADGRVYTGRQALAHKLVDKLGNYQDAIKITAEMVDLGEEPEIVQDKKKSSVLEWLLGREFEIALPIPLRLTSGVYYLWPAW